MNAENAQSVTCLCVDRRLAILRGQVYSISIGTQLAQPEHRGLHGNLFTYIDQDMCNGLRLHADAGSVKADIQRVHRFLEKRDKAIATVPLHAAPDVHQARLAAREAVAAAAASINSWASEWTAELLDPSGPQHESEIALSILMRISLRVAVRHAAPELVGRIAHLEDEAPVPVEGPQAPPPKGHELRKAAMGRKLTSSTRKPVPRGHGRRQRARHPDDGDGDDDVSEDEDDNNETGVTSIAGIKVFPRYRVISRLVRMDRSILSTAGFAAESANAFVDLLNRSVHQPPAAAEQIESFITDGLSILATRKGPRSPESAGLLVQESKSGGASGSNIMAAGAPAVAASALAAPAVAAASLRAAPAAQHGTATTTIQAGEELRLDDIIVASHGVRRQRHEVDRAVANEWSLQHSRSCAVYPAATRDSPTDSECEPNTLVVLLCPHSARQLEEVDSFSGTQSVSLLCLHKRVRLVDAFPHLLSESDPEPSPDENDEAVRWISWMIMQGGYAHVVFCGEKVQNLLHKMLSQLSTIGNRNAAARVTQRHERDSANRFQVISVEVQRRGPGSTGLSESVKTMFYEASHPSPRVTTGRTNYAAMMARIAQVTTVPLPATTRGPPGRPWKEMLRDTPGTTTTAPGPWYVAMDPGNHSPLFAFVFKVNTAGALVDGFFANITKASLYSGSRSSDCWRHDSIMWARPKAWGNRRWFGWSPHYRRAASLAVGRFQQLLTQSVSAADFLRATEQLNMGPSPHQHPPWVVQRTPVRAVPGRCPLSFGALQDGNALDRLLTYNTSMVRPSRSSLHHSYPVV